MVNELVTIVTTVGTVLITAAVVKFNVINNKTLTMTDYKTTEDNQKFLHKIKIPIVLQNMLYPNGCEVASLSSVLHYYGISATLDDLNKYLPKRRLHKCNDKWYGPDPVEYYINEPTSCDGWYCFGKPLAQAAADYLRNIQPESLDDFTIQSVNFYTLSDLKDEYIDRGIPVIIWTTLDYENPILSRNVKWYLFNYPNIIYTPYVNLHCVVLFDINSDTCRIMDPLKGIVSVSSMQLAESYKNTGFHALVIMKNN